MRQDYDEEAKLYVIRRNLKLSKVQFDVRKQCKVEFLSFITGSWRGKARGISDVRAMEV